MAANVNKWSETPASNATADPAINWAEGQAPSTVNDSARQMMAAIAADRDDTRGSLTFGGTSAALTLATNSGNVTYQNGLRVSGKLASAFTAGATLNVDSVGAKNIYRITGTGAAAIQPSDGATGQHVAFEYDASLNSSVGGWVFIGEAYGRVINRQIFQTAGTPTYTRTPGTTTIDVYLIGGCGAGGGAPATGAGVLSLGSGGGTGALTVAIGIAAPATAAVVIGAGGVGASGAGGGNGGSSSFNGTITAPGGGGGNIAGPTSGIFVAQPGGAAGAGAGGTFNFPGITGGYAITSSSGIGVAAGALIYAIGLIRHAGPGSANGASQSAITGATGDPGLCVVVEYS